MKPELNHNATSVKRPFKLEEIWRIRTRIEIQNPAAAIKIKLLRIIFFIRSNPFLVKL
jgi:hypothetical protein